MDEAVFGDADGPGDGLGFHAFILRHGNLYARMADRYDPSSFEAKWREKWAEADLFRTREREGAPKFYGMDFFPYPSGAGLSVGHCRNYVPTDVLCRMKAMQGYNVLHPMGFDAFGLPAENEAIKRGTHPAPMIERYAAPLQGADGPHRRLLRLVPLVLLIRPVLLPLDAVGVRGSL